MHRRPNGDTHIQTALPSLLSDPPGWTAGALDISVIGDALRIAGQTTGKNERKNCDVVHSERPRGTIPLGPEPEKDAVETKLADGVLTIMAAAPETATPGSRKVEMKSG